MQITIQIDDSKIDAALEDVHARYWCSYLTWINGHGAARELEGKDGKPVMHRFDRAKIAQTLTSMLEAGKPVALRVIRGETDGNDRDCFLQLIVFGELKYG